MKKFKLFAALFAILALAVACDPIEPNPTPDPDKPGETDNGKGTQESPYTVAGAIKAASGEAWVKGTIVGVMVPGDNVPEFSANNDTVTQNVIIADSIGEEVLFMPVQLPKGEIRDLVNIAQNKDNFGKEILMFGTIAEYFQKPGVKNPVYVKIDDKEAGVVPGSGIFSFIFNKDMGGFTEYSVVGDQKWELDVQHNCIVMKGAVKEGEEYVNYDNEDWLITPAIDLTKVDAAKFTINHVIRYTSNPLTDCTVWVSENYTEGNPNDAAWSQIQTSFREATDWIVEESGEMSLTPYCGKSVRIAFKYSSKATAKAGTWQLTSMLVEEGEAAEDPNKLNPQGEGTLEKPYNIDATVQNQGQTEKWVEGYIVGVYNFDSSEKFIFGLDSIDSNILLADVAGASDKYISVQLPAGEIRNALNIKDTPSNLGKKVKVYGDLIKYCGIAGVKGLIKAEIDGKLIDCEVKPGEATPITVAEFIKKPVDSKVWFELTGTIGGKINTTYGNFDLTDETGTVFVYGLTKTPQSKNDKTFASLGLKEGDKITLRGTRGDYNGKVEVMNAYFVKKH